MSQFTFNLNGAVVNQADLNNLAGATTKFESSLYSQTKDSDLTYTGSDSIVWDRINSERLRRGLSSLTDIGYPRPADDAAPVAAAPAGGEQTFTIKGPPGMTLEQAQAIFKQQVDSGGLTGFRVGDAINASTQAADGLATAQAQAQQGIASALDKLPQGTDLNSLSAGIASRIQSVLPGAIATTQANLPGEIATMQGKLPAAIGALTGQAGQLGSIANNAIKALGGAISGVPLNGINIADYAKQGPSLGPIGSLDTSMVTGALAQASKLVGQSISALSNNLGAGKFGFDAGQLEKAGFLKPGTSADFLSAGQAELTDVLKSPLPWTGKDGVKGINDLLGNGKLQDKIQQGLMSSGLSDLKQLGMPTDKLNPQAIAGLATNAAKSVTDTLAWTKNSPQLPTQVKSVMDKVAANSAFAVNLTESKVDSALKQEEPAPVATDTVNSVTVDAAAARIVGNDKVPIVTASSGGGAEITILNFIELMNNANASFDVLMSRVNTLSQQSQLSQTDWNEVNEEFLLIKSTYNSKHIELRTAADTAIKTVLPTDPNYAKLINLYNGLPKLFELLKVQSETIKKIIASLAAKISTVQSA